MTVGQPAGSRSGMLSALSAGPCFREKCTESKRDEKSCWGPLCHWLQGDLCASGEIGVGRGRRHLHSSTYQ